MHPENHSPKSSHFITHRLIWWILLIIILCTAGIRLRLIETPLERDEGEYAYAGQLILQGIPPYEQLYNMKLPGIYAAYAVILAIFGQTHGGIHLGLLVINALTILLIFLLAKRLIDSLAGCVAAACFAVLSMGQSVQGIFANAEHFVILPAAAGLFLLVWGLDEEKPWLIFGAGLMLGIGFLMKQHGAAFIAFGGLYTLITQFKKPLPEHKVPLYKIALFTTGALIPYAITCLIFAILGIFDKFWFWTVDYAMAYSAQIPLDLAWGGFKDRASDIFSSAPLLWILATIGLMASAWDRETRKRSLFIMLFVLFSFLAICPGFYFRPHYFILTLPAAAVLGGIGVSAVVKRYCRVGEAERNPPVGFVSLHPPYYWGAILAVVICISISLWQQRIFLFQMTPFQASRSTYGLNPFPESLEIARFIRANTTEKDRIVVIGSEPQIYFYSGRRAATGYIYMYPMMEYHDFALQMQKEMIKEIESAQPEILVFTNISTSWLMRKNSHRFIFEWLEAYEKKYYGLIGRVEIMNHKSLYRWGADVNLPSAPDYWVAVMKRSTR